MTLTSLNNKLLQIPAKSLDIPERIGPGIQCRDGTTVKMRLVQISNYC